MSKYSHFPRLALNATQTVRDTPPVTFSCAALPQSGRHGVLVIDGLAAYEKHPTELILGEK